MSKEFNTLENHAPELERALSGLERDMVHFLKQEGFITSEVYEDTLNPRPTLSRAQKAGELVRGIVNTVSNDSSLYHTLLRRFRESGPHYRGITNILDGEFNGTPQGSDAFQEPANIPPQPPIQPRELTFEDYVAGIPAHNRYRLDKELDFDHNDVDVDLGAIAGPMLDWELLAPALSLTDVDIKDILSNNSRQPVLQRREALQKWKGKFGFQATYRALLRIFVANNDLKSSHKCALKIREVLGATGN